MLLRSTSIRPSWALPKTETAAGFACGGGCAGGHFLSAVALRPESDTMHAAVQRLSLGARLNLHSPPSCVYWPVRLPAERHSALEFAIAMAEEAVSGAFCCAQPESNKTDMTKKIAGYLMAAYLQGGFLFDSPNQALLIILLPPTRSERLLRKTSSIAKPNPTFSLPPSWTIVRV